MAKKKVSDTIEQQRKARAEFLKLKQMQMGQTAPEPKPSVVAITPKTFSEKMANFWFHYKYVLIFGTLISVIFIVLVAQCATKTESDLDIVYFSYTPLLEADVAKVEEYFEQYLEDLNEDEEVDVNIINCSYSNESVDYNYRNTMLQRLQTALVANSKAIVYITDSESMKYFEEISAKGTIFEDEPKPLKEEFFKELDKSELGAYLPRDLQISLRKTFDTKFEKDNEAKECFKASKKLLENVAK